MSEPAEPNAEETARIDRDEVERAARAEAARAAAEARSKVPARPALSDVFRRLGNRRKPPRG